MAKPKPDKFTATPDKTRQYKPVIQIEGKLAPAQLEAIAGGGLNYN